MTIGQQIWKRALSQKTLPRYGRGAIVVNLTTRCNFACKHCMRRLSDPKDIPFELLEKMITQAKGCGFNFMSLTGGEPLLYPRFRDLLNLLIRNDFVFNIATNGFILENFYEILKKFKKNIEFIQFSLENTEKKLHDAQRRDGAFDKVLAGIRFCRDNKIPFRFMTAASTVNFEKLFDIALFAKKKGAYVLAVTTVLPCPRSEGNELVLSEDKRKQLSEHLPELSRILRYPVMATSAIRTGGPVRFCSGLSLNEIAFDVDGNATQCCDLANFDDEKIRAGAVIASLKDRTFEEVLLACSKHVSQCDAQRIKDFAKEPDPQGVNFNSCFYCLRKYAGLF